jgi:integrase
MGKRQPNGAGSIFRHRGGWRLELRIRQPDGSMKRVTRDRKRQSDLVTLREQLLFDAKSTPSLPVAAFPTVPEWLAQWLEAGRPSWASSTFTNYRQIVSKWIVGRTGPVRVPEFSAGHVRALLSEAAADGAGVRTQQVIREALLSAFNMAKRDGMIISNPVEGIPVPRGDADPEIRPFTEPEARALLAKSSGHRYHAAVAMMLTLGLRIGEVAGLRKDHVSMAARTVRIEEQITLVWGVLTRKRLKTKHSKRTLSLPEEAVKALFEHEAIMLREGRRDRDILFPTKDGKTINRAVFSHSFWKPLLKRCGIEARGVHHARHTFATMTLRHGVALHVVSRMLGHSSPGVTLSAYAHYVPDDQSRAVSAIDAIMRGAGNCHQNYTRNEQEQSQTDAG